MEHRRRHRLVLSITALLLIVASVPMIGAAAGSNAEPVVNGADRHQSGIIAWALDRQEAAGLGPPDIDRISVHAEASGCRGNDGYHGNAERRVDLCVAGAGGRFRHTLLPWLAHGWDFQEMLTGGARAEFVDLRHVEDWSGTDLESYEQGKEQLAEIIAWRLDHTAPDYRPAPRQDLPGPAGGLPHPDRHRPAQRDQPLRLTERARQNSSAITKATRAPSTADPATTSHMSWYPDCSISRPVTSGARNTPT